MLIILTGPPGVGKSTVGEKLAKMFPRSVNFSLDDLRSFVKSGNVPPWEDTEEEGQSVLATRIAIDMVKRYEAKNFVVILDDVIDDPQVEVYMEELSDVKAFLLLPRLEVAQQRDMGRSPHKQMGERVKVLHDELSNKNYIKIEKIDSSDQSPEETANLIYSKVVS